MTTIESSISPLRPVIDATAAAVAANSKNAAAVFSAKHQLIGTTKVAVQVGTGNSFNVDEPSSLGGENSAANPVEYALASLGSCQVITYQFWAAHLGLRLDTVEVDVEGDLDVRGFFGLDESVRPGLGAVRVNVRLGGPESEADYQRLAKAVDDHCPVLDLFTNGVAVDFSVAVS